MAAPIGHHRMVNDLKGQARRGAERRDAIVAAAIEVFAQKGFRSGALVEVADRVGLTPAGILYHFGSKEALLVAVMAERDRRQGDIILELASEEGLEAYRQVVRFAEISEQEPGLTALHTVLQIESIEPGHPAHDYFQARSRALRQWNEMALLAAQRSGAVRPDVDCAAKAREVVAFLEGAAVLWLVDRSVSLVELYRGYFDSLVESLQPPRPT